MEITDNTSGKLVKGSMAADPFQIESTLLKSFQTIDSLTPVTIMGDQFRETARLAVTIAGSESLLAATRSVKLAGAELSAASSLASSGIALPKIEPLKLPKIEPLKLPNIAESFIGQTNHIVRLANTTIASGMASSTRSILADSINGLTNYANSSLASPTLSSGGIEHAANAALGLTVSGSILDGFDAKTELGEITRTSERTQPSLEVALSALDPTLVEKLHGAADRIKDAGSDSFSQGANSLIELIDWTLRLGAPEAHTLDWRNDGHSGIDDLDTKGKPTRALKVRYMLRTREIDSKLAKLYVGNIVGIVSIGQGSKHTLGRNDFDTLRGLYSTTVSTLAFILGCEEL